MPRWLFILLATALALSVLGSVLIVLRSPNSTPPLRGAAAGAPAPGPQTRPDSRSP